MSTVSTHYKTSPMEEWIENTFRHHPPFGDQLDRYKLIRDEAKAFAYLLVSLTPSSDEQSRALVQLDQVVTCANAAIARHETPEPPKPFKYAGCYGGHDPNELPDDSEEAGGDPILRDTRPTGNVIPC